MNESREGIRTRFDWKKARRGTVIGAVLASVALAGTGWADRHVLHLLGLNPAFYRTTLGTPRMSWRVTGDIDDEQQYAVVWTCDQRESLHLISYQWKNTTPNLRARAARWMENRATETAAHLIWGRAEPGERQIENGFGTPITPDPVTSVRGSRRLSSIELDVNATRNALQSNATMRLTDTRNGIRWTLRGNELASKTFEECTNAEPPSGQNQPPGPQRQG